MPLNRRDFLTRTTMATAAASVWPTRAAAQRKPHDFIIVEGHRDIWEFNDRFQLPDRKQHSCRDHAGRR